MGGIALSLLLIAEFTLVLWLRGLSIKESLAARDPVAGTVYYVALGVFAVMPLLGGCRREQIFDEESITCRRTSVRNLLISRTTTSIPDRLLVARRSAGAT